MKTIKLSGIVCFIHFISSNFAFVSVHKCKDIPNGNVSDCSEHINIQNLCTLNCHDGYYADPLPLVLCMTNGQWDSNPSCKEIFKLPTNVTARIGDGYFKFNKYLWQVTSGWSNYTVDVVTPNGTRTKADVNNKLMFLGFEYHIPHEVKSEDGGMYKFIIDVKKKNGHSYTWMTNTTFVIKGSYCSPLTIANATVECVDDLDFEQTSCSFVCDEGFNLLGSPMLNCSYNNLTNYLNEWRNIPVCQITGYNAFTANTSLGVLLGLLTLLNTGLAILILCRNNK